MEYNHKEIEKKWQDKWAADKTYRTPALPKKDKCYVLDMFPYPSGVAMHVGHPKGYVATDVFSRMKRMQGYDVLHPMGWDAFGLPAENYAIKNKTHPRKAVEENLKRYKEQLQMLGVDYDWEREINTTDPAYYKWTQWIFLQLFNKGLAYESDKPINWCPSCKTGLANEDLEGGKCERCASEVEQKPMRQWVLRITKYADRLLEGLHGLDWEPHIKEMQRNGIGKSEGVNFTQKIKDLDLKIEAYDSIPQTFMAQTFAVIAPEHPLVSKLITGTTCEKPVMQFVESFKKRKLQNQFSIDKEIEGIFTGRYIENPFGTGDLPIWIATFVVYGYGTGFVNCSAHDERDFAFAKKYGIPLRVVMLPKDTEHAKRVTSLEMCYHHDPLGVLQAPEDMRGKTWAEAREEILTYIEKKGFGKRTTHYKLRDWVFSRQRYWGEPIPIIHCEKCGPVGVPEKDLPVTLPEVESYEPTGTGESPLASIPEWVNTICPKCAGAGKRETNTMPQWAGSSWYYLRYIDPKNDSAIVDVKKEKIWMPVDCYVGGAEHATRHLIYARFWHKFLYDIGVVSTEEPFTRLQHVGLVLAEDGRKMSKRWNNVINPDDVVERSGGDTVRCYEMFMGPFENEIAWSTESMIGVRRFLERVARLEDRASNVEPSKDLLRLMHESIKKVSENILSFRFNTAISQLMIFSRALDEHDPISKEVYKILLQLLAPFAPHITEEVWFRSGEQFSIHRSDWPRYDASCLAQDELSIAVQVNGKVRGTVLLAPDATETAARNAFSEHSASHEWLKDGQIDKFIYVRGKVISVVVKP